MLATLGGGAADALTAQPQPAEQPAQSAEPTQEAPQSPAPEQSAPRQAAVVDPAEADTTIVMQAIPANREDRTLEDSSSKEPVRTN